MSTDEKSPFRVLLIEDDGVLARTTTRLLRSMFPQCEVTLVLTASSAIAELVMRGDDGVDPDLILSDFDLHPEVYIPGGLDTRTGGTVLMWIREHRPDLEKRFVFFTGNPGVAEEFTDRVIMKGCPVDEFRVKLRAFLGLNGVA